VNTRPLLLVTAASLAIQLGLAAWTLGTVGWETRVPIHWGIDGTADGFAPAWVAVAITPAITLLLGPLLAVLPRFDPRRENLARSSTAYLWICGSLVALMAGMQLLICQAARDPGTSVFPFLGIGVGVILVVIGVFLGRTESNWFMGIRTPWTLSSDRSWARTHRVGGYLFMGFGIAVVASALWLPPGTFFWVLMIGLAGSVALLFVYSYLAWRDDPDRSSA
jgi:uncharacterized membrane protein